MDHERSRAVIKRGYALERQFYRAMARLNQFEGVSLENVSSMER